MAAKKKSTKAQAPTAAPVHTGGMRIPAKLRQDLVTLRTRTEAAIKRDVRDQALADAMLRELNKPGWEKIVVQTAVDATLAAKK